MLHLRNFESSGLHGRLRGGNRYLANCKQTLLCGGKKTTQVVGRKTRFPANREFVQKPSVVKAMFLKLSHIKVADLYLPEFPGQPTLIHRCLYFCIQIYSPQSICSRKALQEQKEKKHFLPQGKKIAQGSISPVCLLLIAMLKRLSCHQMVPFHKIHFR